MEGEMQYVGAKKKPDGSLDLSEAAMFIPKKVDMQGVATPENTLTSDQQRMIGERGQKNKDFFAALERGGGSVEVQEAKLKVQDLTEQLERFKNDPRMRDDAETIEWYENEIILNQRVVDGEKLVNVLDSIQTEDDKRRIAETREKIKNMTQL